MPDREHDRWLEARDEWLEAGRRHKYLRSDVHCATHDSTPLDSAEINFYDDGQEECIPIVRIADSPAEEYIPRFGPLPWADLG